MTGVVRIDEHGQIVLPVELRDAFGGPPGMPLRVEVSRGRMEITNDGPEVESTSVSPTGRVVSSKVGFPLNAAKAVREERDALSDRAGRP